MAKKENLEQLIRSMPVHWSLEHYTEPSGWIVFDSSDGRTLGAGTTPEEALLEARDNPMSPKKAQYYPRYGWSLLGPIFKLK